MTNTIQGGLLQAIQDCLRKHLAPALLHKLVKDGADPNEVGPYGETALHVAAAIGDDKLVEMLISLGASVELKDTNGSLPEDMARRNGHAAVAVRLQQSFASERGRR